MSAQVKSHIEGGPDLADCVEKLGVEAGRDR
jgi:hypothetical protein